MEGIEWTALEGQIGPASDEYLDGLIEDLERTRFHPLTTVGTVDS